MYFDKDRYDSSKMLDKWIEANKDGRTIVVDNIEVEGYERKFEDVIIIFWKQISIIDNQVQDFCAEECSRSGEDIKEYIVDLSWVSIEDGQFEDEEVRDVW